MRISIGADFSDKHLRPDDFRHIPSIRYASQIHAFTQRITNNTPIDIVSICIEAMNERLFLSNTPSNMDEFGIYNYYSLIKSAEKHTISVIFGGHVQKPKYELELIKKRTQVEVDEFLVSILKGLKGIITEQIPALKYSKLTRNDHYLHNLIYQKQTVTYFSAPVV